MISSSFDKLNNTFIVVLDNKIKVSGTFKVLVVRSTSFCGLNFQVECNKHEPPADSGLEQSINFMAAQHEISKKLSDYTFNKIQVDVFTKLEEVKDDDEIK